MSVMAKKKADPTAFTYRPDEDVLKALYAYKKGLEFDVPYTSIIDKAVRTFLRGEGYDDLPEKAGSDE